MNWLRNTLLVYCAIILTQSARPQTPAGSEMAIQWRTESLVKVADGNYGRVKELADGTLAAVYARGGNTYIKFSHDLGKSWQDERMTFEGTDTYNFTNAELIQLANGTLVAGVNRRVKPEWAGKAYTFAILITCSADGGKSWSGPQLLYNAGNVNGIGCWEPAFLQLPGGELQCYFANEQPYPNTNEQQISLLRSFDNGRTWTSAIETVCFARKGRDGMPVPVYDAAKGRIYVAIEENHGGKHVLQPVIISTSINDNWKGGFVGDDDPRRLHVTPDLPPNQYAGAPYLALTKSGLMVLSYQDRGGRTPKKELMKVRILKDLATSATGESIPFPISTDQSALWNSLTILRDGTILAVTSTTAYQGGIYLIKGQLSNQ